MANRLKTWPPVVPTTYEDSAYTERCAVASFTVEACPDGRHHRGATITATITRGNDGRADPEGARAVLIGVERRSFRKDLLSPDDLHTSRMDLISCVEVDASELEAIVAALTRALELARRDDVV